MLSPFVTLEHVALLSCSARTLLDPLTLPEEPPNLQLRQDAEADFDPEHSRLTVFARARFVGLSRDEETLDIEATYRIHYRLPEGMVPTQRDVDEFAQHNGLFNAWPYLRELVSSLSARMGLPLPPLPLLRVGASGAPQLGEE